MGSAVMTPALSITLAAAVLLLLASTLRDMRMLRVGLMLVGGLFAFGYFIAGRWGASAVMALVALVNLIQFAALATARKRVRFSAEEAQLAERALPRMDRSLLRGLLDQGLWIAARPGETLIRQGEPTSHLFYLSEGEVEVASGGRVLATCGPGHFLGEITVLSGAPATATVATIDRARFWCVPAETLARFLAANPDARAALEASFVGDMAEKLRLTNERLARAGG